MRTQRRIAVVKMKRRRITVDLTMHYWALGVAVGRPNLHMQVGPIGIGFLKNVDC